MKIINKKKFKKQNQILKTILICRSKNFIKIKKI